MGGYATYDSPETVWLPDWHTKFASDNELRTSKCPERGSIFGFGGVAVCASFVASAETYFCEAVASITFRYVTGRGPGCRARLACIGIFAATAVPQHPFVGTTACVHQRVAVNPACRPLPTVRRFVAQPHASGRGRSDPDASH